MDLDVYMVNFDLTKEYFAGIRTVCAYLNRQINIDKVHYDDVRNRRDAWDAIISWNNKIDYLTGIRNSLLSSYSNIPDVEFYRIKIEKDEHQDV